MEVLEVLVDKFVLNEGELNGFFEQFGDLAGVWGFAVMVDVSEAIEDFG